ncbi:MAG: rhodanese-like domain-containing protein [Burkholderiales bacterium]
MPDVARISADEVRERLRSGSGAFLVCAYEEAEKCRKYPLEGAISLDELRQRLPSLARTHEIVFYCA